jgi:hypothetical protein
MDYDFKEKASSSSDEDEVARHPRSFSKNMITGGSGAGSAGAATHGPGVFQTSNVHELLECPVCTHSMFPPIHQVLFLPFFFCSMEIYTEGNSGYIDLILVDLCFEFGLVGVDN